MTDYNDGNWHGWNGGECPVHPETVIDALIVFSDGRPGFHQSVPARDLVWPWVESGQITAFRVIEEHREPREWWVVEDGDGCLVPFKSDNPSAFKVREVIE